MKHVPNYYYRGFSFNRHRNNNVTGTIRGPYPKFDYFVRYSCMTYNLHDFYCSFLKFHVLCKPLPCTVVDMHLGMNGIASKSINPAKRYPKNIYNVNYLMSTIPLLSSLSPHQLNSSQGFRLRTLKDTKQNLYSINSNLQ